MPGLFAVLRDCLNRDVGRCFVILSAAKNPNHPAKWRAVERAVPTLPRLGNPFQTVSKKAINFPSKWPHSAPKTHAAGHQNDIHVGECGGFVGVFSLNYPV
jgi:hypothetical protein